MILTYEPSGDDEIVFAEPGFPFDGLTLGKARAINDALAGLLVEVDTLPGYGMNGSTWRFERMQLPGEIETLPRGVRLPVTPWNLILLDGNGRPDSTSILLVIQFRVVEKMPTAIL
jgi:hypothetical protein